MFLIKYSYKILSIELDNIIIVPPWKFRDLDLHGTAAMLSLHRSSACEVNWTSPAAL